MAGSYNHVVENISGKLLVPSELCDMLDARWCKDVYQAIEEMYGMIWLLADELAFDRNVRAGCANYTTAAKQVEFARRDYKAGLHCSPGVDGRISKENP